MKKHILALVVSAMVVATSLVAAAARHEVTYKGTVVSTTDKTIRVDTVDDKKKPLTINFKIDKDTKILRGEKLVAFTAARIVKGEKIAVTIDHDLDEDLALVVRLDEKK